MPTFFRVLTVSLLTTAITAGAQTTAPKTLQIVWRAGGGSDPDSSFALIYAVAVSPSGNVVAWDPKTPALRLFDDAGKPLRTIGRNGAGPGEYGNNNGNGVSGIAFGPDNRLYVWDSGNGRLNVYKPNGDFEKQMRLPITGFYTNNGLTIDNQGRGWFRFVIFDKTAGKTQQAWIRTRISDGSTIDTVKAPTFEGADRELVARSACCMSTSGLPYGRNGLYAVTASGDVMTAPVGKYEIDVPAGGKTVKIQRAYKPVPVPAAERAELTASTERNMRRTQPDWSWPSSGIPSEKPPLLSIASALDGRIWASLSVESEKFTPDAPASREGNAPPPLTFRPSGTKWDVFEADGRYIGTVSAPRNIEVRVMRGDFAWGVFRDEDDVPTLVKLKVVPPFR